MDAKFTTQLIERTVTWADDESEEYTDEDDAGLIEPADLSDVLNALDSQCWDHIEEYGDGTVICYPADSHHNPRTGSHESTQLIIKARRPEWADRALRLYRARGGR